MKEPEKRFKHPDRMMADQKIPIEILSDNTFFNQSEFPKLKWQSQIILKTFLR
jgi:hypothetical protein